MADRPDVLWVTLESTRADHTPMYGYDRNTTPNLAKLVARDDGTLLNNTVSASNWTRPSTASMLTGTHYSTHNTGGRGARGTKLPDHLDTLPEYLSQDGYDTALFSPAPQISSDTGLDRGFDHYELISAEAENFLPGSGYSLDSWMSVVHHLISEPGLNPIKSARDVDDVNYIQYRRFRRWIDQSRRSERPFFAYAHVWSPHSPYQPIRRHCEEFVGQTELDMKEAYRRAKQEYQNLTEKIANSETFSEKEWRAFKWLYDAEIRYADEMLGRMVDLAESVSDNLVIVVTGDHGELFGEKGVISHKITLHDGAIKVPGVIVGMDGVTSGPEEMTQHIDLTRTVGELLDTPLTQFEGRDLRDEGRTYAIAQRREWDFSDYTDINPAFDHSRFIEQPYTAVVTPGFKYIVAESTEALYKLPDEATDVSDRHANVVARLTDAIEAEAIKWNEKFERNTATFDDEAEQKLRDLGYLS